MDSRTVPSVRRENLEGKKKRMEPEQLDPLIYLKENETGEETMEQILNLHVSVIEKYLRIDETIANELMLQLSYFLFEQQCYEYSVRIWSRLLDQDYKKSEIISVIEESFINPNLEEIRAIYQDNIEKYQDHFYGVFPCDFAQLPYRLIPVDANTYYLWDWRHQKLNGKVILQKEDDIDTELALYDTILCIDSWDFIAPICAKQINSEELICFANTDNVVFCYLMFPEFEAIFGEHWYMFDGAGTIEAFFHENRTKSLPRKFFGGTEEELILHRAWIDKEHSFRCSKAGRTDQDILLTIGIPSFNRGQRALENIQHLLKLPYDFEVEFLVINNCSIENTEGYDEIEKLQEVDHRIRYYRFTDTPGGHWSGYEALQQAKGKFCCLLSDEDKIVLDNVGKYLRIIQKYGNSLGFIGSAGREYYIDVNQNEKVEKGDKAFTRLFWRLNYISGLIFNTAIWREKNLYASLAEIGKENYFVAAYGYNVGALHICLERDVYFSKEQLFFEGRAEKSSAGSEVKNGKRILTYATLSKRVEQLEGALQVLNECAPHLAQKTIVQVYVSLCYKIFFLLDLYRRIHGEIECSYEEAYETVLRVCINNIQNLNVTLENGDFVWMVSQILQAYSENLKLLQIP